MSHEEVWSTVAEVLRRPEAPAREDFLVARPASQCFQACQGAQVMHRVAGLGIKTVSTQVAQQ